MRLLLDTHAFLWLLGSPEKLSRAALQACQDPENTLWLSLVSIWEIQIKVQLKKLRLEAPLSELVEASLRENQMELLPIELAHILALDGLPHHHRDPFDRLLIAQAQIADVPLVTGDSAIGQYSVEVLW